MHTCDWLVDVVVADVAYYLWLKETQNLLNIGAVCMDLSADGIMERLQALQLSQEVELE